MEKGPRNDTSIINTLYPVKPTFTVFRVCLTELPFFFRFNHSPQFLPVPKHTFTYVPETETTGGRKETKDGNRSKNLSVSTGDY